jgi:murein DD-endopeptidase MepM/ murein hydrolase activator NlpD
VRELIVAAALIALALAPAAEASESPMILSTYRSMTGANQLRRAAAHAGVDFGGSVGAPVLAAAGGIVHRLIDYPPGCGTGVVLAHPELARYTAYCHLERRLVDLGQTVARGQPIGLMGTSGNAVGIPHVHLDLCTQDCRSHADGDLRGTADPLRSAAGCFDPERRYPATRLVLTHPVRCGPASRAGER